MINPMWRRTEESARRKEQSYHITGLERRSRAHGNPHQGDMSSHVAGPPQHTPSERTTTDRSGRTDNSRPYESTMPGVSSEVRSRVQPTTHLVCTKPPPEGRNERFELFYYVGTEPTHYRGHSRPHPPSPSTSRDDANNHPVHSSTRSTNGAPAVDPLAGAPARKAPITTGPRRATQPRGTTTPHNRRDAEKHKHPRCTIVEPFLECYMHGSRARHHLFGFNRLRKGTTTPSQSKAGRSPKGIH
ncbi:hypothetical protein BHE74_00006634 [Ensete ventricosum]|nr:hypothetical protein BHE74_00006634 [Ensete ventricosum]